MSETRVNVVVTGPSWMGSGIGSIESVLERLFREAEQEITMAVYAVGSGAGQPLDWLEIALARGVQVRFIVNRLYEQPSEMVARLRQLVEAYPHLYLYNFTPEEDADLHAKVIVIDRRLALIGSANLSRRGLLANHELALLVEGSPVADVARAMDYLSSSEYVMRVQD